MNDLWRIAVLRPHTIDSEKVVDCPFPLCCILPFLGGRTWEEQIGMHSSFSQFIKLGIPLSACPGPKPHDVIGHLLDAPSVGLAFRLIHHVNLQGWGSIDWRIQGKEKTHETIIFQKSRGTVTFIKAPLYVYYLRMFIQQCIHDIKCLYDWSLVLPVSLGQEFCGMPVDLLKRFSCPTWPPNTRPLQSSPK